MIAPAFQTGHVKVYLGDALATLRLMPEDSVDCVVTSPPYWGLRDYGVAGQVGLEPSLGAYIDVIVETFREVRRVLRRHGTLWLNIGDSYAQDGKWGGAGDGSADAGVNIPGRAQYPRTRKVTGLKPKDMVGMPWRIAFALQEDGWYLRSDIIWAKPNPMPESVGDRPTKAHEYVFLFAKSERYYYDAAAIAEPLTAASMARISQASFDAQKGGPKDYGKVPAGWNTGDGNHRDDQSGRYTEINKNRSQRRALENLHAKNVVPPDPDPGPLWNQPGRNSRANVDRDPRHLEDGGKQERRLYKTDEHNRFGKASANRVWDDVGALDRMIENGRNARTVWEIATQPYPEAHFATFPEELPRRCIAAGTPERVCTECGKPSTRILAGGGGDAYEKRGRVDGRPDGEQGERRKKGGGQTEWDSYERPQTIGWTDCGHAAYVPGTVLDPFAGSGTTLAVARDLARQAIGIELHADYLGLIVRRCQQEALPWTGDQEK